MTIAEVHALPLGAQLLCCDPRLAWASPKPFYLAKQESDGSLTLELPQVLSGWQDSEGRLPRRGSGCYWNYSSKEVGRAFRRAEAPYANPLLADRATEARAFKSLTP